jgi:MFS family permease
MKLGSETWRKNSITMSLSSTPNIIIESSWTYSRTKILKNLFVIGLAWILLFTAFQSMANLQSSLNSNQGLGTASLSVIYITLVISCLFLPTLLIKKLGLKLTIVLSQFTYLLYIAANVYPEWYFLLPSAVLLGTGAGPLWTAKCTYLTEIAGFYSKLTGESNEVVVNRFFGIFFCMFQMSQIIGNIISSTILKPDKESESSKITVKNLNCGAKDCPGTAESGNIIRPELSTVYNLCFIYILLGLASIVLIMCFLNNYKQKNPEKSRDYAVKSSERTEQFELLISTIDQLKNRYQILIIPLTLWLGFSLAFIGADFTKSFVACAQGVDKVGYAMLCFGLTDVIGSYFFGQLMKHIGRMPCFIIAAVLNYSMIFLMLVWDLQKTSASSFLFYFVPACWGLADAAWQTQVNSIYGVLFQANQEAAFSNFRLWESVGFAISYAYSNYLCVTMKLYLLIIYLTFGMIGYFLIEYSEYRKGYKQTGSAGNVCKVNLTPRFAVFFCLGLVKLLLIFYFVYG